MNKSSGSSAGIGLWGCVFIVFLIMKLAEIGVVANWSWWWVTAPLWLPITLVVCGLIIWFVIYVVISVLRNIKRNRR